MPKHRRPVGPIPGTSLVKAFDVGATQDLARLALAQADEGPEDLIQELLSHIGGKHIVANDGVRDVLDRRYARGIADALSWFAGESPSAELIEFLDLRTD